MNFQRQHIEEIRRNKYGIGRGPVTIDVGDLRDMITGTTHRRFLFELIQNAEDNEYDEGIKASLEFVITSRDITATGAQTTLLVFNNEKGFSRQNIDSICGSFESTKRESNIGLIGERGIGFKTSFSVSSKPYIFSNGYKIRFNEDPCPDCGIPFIVPEWIEDKPTLTDIQDIYGEGLMPNTIFVFPLKPKLPWFTLQLQDLQPEFLLFLTKITQISARDVETRQSILSLSSDILCETKRSPNVDTSVIALFAKQQYRDQATCIYLLWKHKFPIRSKNRFKEKKDVKEWTVTLAFPFSKRQELYRHMIPPDLFAFFPTNMVSKFPFIIQGDFVLTSTKDKLGSNNSWNQGILECVPIAFTEAFKSFVLGLGLGPELNQPPASLVVSMFKFLPFESSEDTVFVHVQREIKIRLFRENIVPIEPFIERQFCRPGEVSRVLPEFNDILVEAEYELVHLPILSSYDGKKILCRSFCPRQYRQVLDMLGLESVNHHWYAKCLEQSSLVSRVSHKLYQQLLKFVRNYWSTLFDDSYMKQIPLIKYQAAEKIEFFSVHECTRNNRVAKASQHPKWLISWNDKLRAPGNLVFIPEETEKEDANSHILRNWLRMEVGVSVLNVFDFAKTVSGFIKKSNEVHSYADFIFQSFSKGYLESAEVKKLCKNDFVLMLKIYKHLRCKEDLQLENFVSVLKDGFEGTMLYCVEWKGVLEISDISFINPLGEEIDEYKEELKLLGVGLSLSKNYEIFMKHLNKSMDWASLTADAAFLIMKGIRFFDNNGLRQSELLGRFKEESFLKTNKGYQKPTYCFLDEQMWSSMLQNDPSFKVIDKTFYTEEIISYTDELRKLGVVVEFEDAKMIITRRIGCSTCINEILCSYRYLAKLDWKPEDNRKKKVWIPNGTAGRKWAYGEGRWVKSEECIIHDPDKFFRLEFFVLDNISEYDVEILSFLTKSMEVKSEPSVDDYFRIWNRWPFEQELSYEECHKFWLFLVKHMNTLTESKLSEMKKLPVTTSGSNKVFLLDKKDVFIPDMSSLQKLFEDEKLFVWYPDESDESLSVTKLNEIYRVIGARNISESVIKEPLLVHDDDVKRVFNLKGLVKLILGFLACSKLKMEPDKRHEAVKDLLSLSFIERKVAVTVSYTLSLSSGKIVQKGDDKLVHWDRENSRCFIWKMDGNARDERDCARHFSETISKGVLSENIDYVPALSGLIQESFILKFNDECIDDLMKKKKFQIFSEDEKLLGIL